jgi:non-specific serine/threonine protein kinase
MVRSDIELFREFDFTYIVLMSRKPCKIQTFNVLPDYWTPQPFAMTGTPVRPIRSICNHRWKVSNPGLSWSAEFFSRLNLPRQIDKKCKRGGKAAQLRKIVHPPCLNARRKCSQLPDKTESIIYCEMIQTTQSLCDTFRVEMYAKKLWTKWQLMACTKNAQRHRQLVTVAP